MAERRPAIRTGASPDACLVGRSLLAGGLSLLQFVCDKFPRVGPDRGFKSGGMRSRRHQPVLVLPGFGAGDRSTIGLRSQLAALGHPVHRWHQGRNEGPSPEILDGLDRRFHSLYERYEKPIAIVGWSLGGIYAWGIAKRRPDQVQQVITLGSPLNSTGVADSPPPVPLTSIWTRSDRIVRWQSSFIEEGDRRQNIEVRATHVTLGFDPLVVAAIADRLGQRPERWEPFRPLPWLRSAYPKPVS